MNERKPEAAVAGHICLDVIPELSRRDGGIESLLVPGKLVECGPALLSTGGAVPNSGITLHRLGFGVRLMGKIAGDDFGRAVLELLAKHDTSLAGSMIVAPDGVTSYSIVISPPGVDRIFLHCPGANDTFSADDIDYSSLEGARLFHFGYPPIMKRIRADGGAELVSIFRRVKEMGLTTSLDMSRPDPDTEAGGADWRALLERVLPFVDVFLPSAEEIIFMLDRHFHDELQTKLGPAGLIHGIGSDALDSLLGSMIDMGAAIAGIKLGDRGLCVRTTADVRRLSKMGKCAPANLDQWAGRELYSPCFSVNVAGATGAGDSTIAGFLAGLLKGLGPEETLTAALATGACNVERPDAVSGIPSWNELLIRIDSGWPRRETEMTLTDWKPNPDSTIRFGPNDRRNRAGQ